MYMFKLRNEYRLPLAVALNFLTFFWYSFACILKIH